MGRVKRFQELIAWEKAIELFVQSIQDMESMPKTRAATLVADQLLGAVGSISAQIAAGFGQKGSSKFGHLLGAAKGSALEAQDWYIKCSKAFLLPQAVVDQRLVALDELFKMLTALIAKGSKRSKTR